MVLFALIVLGLSGYYFFNYKLLPPPISEAKIDGLGVVKVGDLIEHPKFGEGIIKSIRAFEEGDDSILTIKFNNVGKKHLVASAINLESAN